MNDKETKSVRFGQNTIRTISRRPNNGDINNDNINNNRREDNNDDSDDVGNNGLICKKRPRKERPNEDEMDDVDDWVAEDDELEQQRLRNENDDKNNMIPNKKELLKLKRKRRKRKDDGYDDDDDDDENNDDDANNKNGSNSFETTNIDATTSLASEEIPFEPFDMKKESTDGTGYFDGDTYVFRKEGSNTAVGPGEEPDAWLDALSQKDDSTAGIAYQSQEQQPSKDIIDDNNDISNSSSSNNNNMDDWSKEKLYETILPLVGDTETVMQALIRYGNLLKRKTVKKGTSISKEQLSKPTHVDGSIGNNIDDDDDKKKGASSLESSSLFARDAFDDLTSASSSLLLKGDVNIYQKTRTHIMQLVPKNKEGTTIITQQTEGEIGMVSFWEYSGRQDGKVHGPYSTKQMLQWTQAGYFIGDNAVYVRKIQKKEEEKESNKNNTCNETAPAGKKENIVDLLSDLMDDDDDDDNDNENDNDNDNDSSNFKIDNKSVDNDSNNQHQKENDYNRGKWISSNEVNFASFT